MDDLTLLNSVRAAVQGVRGNSALNGLTYGPEPLTWSDGTVCRCCIWEPGMRNAGPLRALAQALRPEDIDPLEQYQMTVHPDDELPGTHASTTYDGDTLTVTGWSSPDPISGERIFNLRRS